MAKTLVATAVKKKKVKGLVGKPITTLKQLKGAGYNPRTITSSRLKDLGNSLSSFGDLSGVVFNNNAKSGVLISGHQRVDSIKNWDTRIETQVYTDEHGTIAQGYIHATNAKGKTISIPLRIVNWSDKKAEYAANIASNAHGGEFDNKKLATLVEKLDFEHMPSSLIGLDPLHLRGLKQTLGRAAEKIEADARAGRTTGKMNGSAGQFNEYSAEDVESDLSCKCPRCGFQFNA